MDNKVKSTCFYGVFLCASIALATVAGAQSAPRDFERDCIDNFNQVVSSTGNFRARYETARGCLEAARPRMFISSTREFRTALRENIRVYSRMMASSALTLQLSEEKIDPDLSHDALASFQGYMVGEYPEISPDNIDRYFEDMETLVTLGLFSGEYRSSAEPGARAIDVYSKFRGSPWIETGVAGSGDAPDEVAGIETVSVLSAVMSGEKQLFLDIASDSLRSRMAAGSCVILFSIAENPGTSNNPLSVFMARQRQDFFAAVLKTVSVLKDDGSQGEKALVSCVSNLGAFFARIGDLETSSKIYGDIAATAVPSFDTETDIGRDMLPKIIGLTQNPNVKGGAACALGEIFMTDGDQERAERMFLSAYSILSASGEASRNNCWLKGGCSTVKKYLRKDQKGPALRLALELRESAEKEGIASRENYVHGIEAAARDAVFENPAMRKSLKIFLDSSPSSENFEFILSGIPNTSWRKKVLDSVTGQKPKLIPAYIRGLLNTADPPDAWAIATAEKQSKALDEDTRNLVSLKAAKLSLKSGKEKEGKRRYILYLRSVPNRRFKDELISAVWWLSSSGKAGIIESIVNEIGKPHSLNAGDFSQIGDILIKSGKPGIAADFYRRSARMNPTSFSANLNLARALNETGNVKDSLEAYRSAAAMGQLPRSDLIGISSSLAGQGKFDEAHSFLDEQIRNQGDSAAAHLANGVVFYVQGQCRNAITSYALALEKNRNLSSAHTNMGFAKLDCGEASEAIKSFQSTLSLSPNKADNFDSNLGMAIAYLRLGNERAAGEHFNKALSLNPSLAGGPGKLSEEGFVYSPKQSEDIKRLISMFGSMK